MGANDPVLPNLAADEVEKELKIVEEGESSGSIKRPSARCDGPNKSEYTVILSNGI